jgi:hypothetical protein
MPAWALLLVGTVAGIVPGALILTLLTLLFLALFRREAFYHACWMVMLLLATLLVGGGFGAVLGALIALQRSGRTVMPSWFWPASAGLAILLAWLFAWHDLLGRWPPRWLWPGDRSSEG